ncbi:MAG: tetratricopeptide repeat protein [Bacteriovoracaceae bacterium]|nr:tetratricopeptide repeat protein [Bacteriovoracaceae bacterium]
MILISGLTLSLSACKTTEQIRQEKRVDDLAMLSADYDGRLQTLEDTVQRLHGQLEENEHAIQAASHQGMEDTQKSIELLTAQFKALQETQQAQAKLLQEIKTQLSAQQKYIGDVATSLTALGPKNNTSPWQTNFDLGQKYFKENKYDKALPLLRPLAQEKNIKGKNRAALLYSLGMMAYAQKENDQAVYYLGTLYQEFPKSTYNQSGLFALGKSFQRMGQNDKAIATWEELQASFPKAKKAATAQAEIKKLQAPHP